MNRRPRRPSSQPTGSLALMLALMLALALGCAGLLTAVTLSTAAAAPCRASVPAGERGSCTIVVSIVRSASVREGNSKTLKVTVTPATHPAFDLLATTANGTARTPGDYRALSQSRVRVAANASSAAVKVRTVDDSALEVPETFTVRVDRSGGRLPGGYSVRVKRGAAKATVTLTDDDSSVVSIADTTAAEGVGFHPILISMTNSAARTCRVTVTSTNDSALVGSDYDGFFGGLFTVSVPRAELLMGIRDDDLIERRESLLITLRLASGSPPECLLGDDLARVTITSDDRPSFVSIADATVNEDDAVRTTLIRMTRPTDRSCQVAVTSANGTALRPGDYFGFSGGLFTLSNRASDRLPLFVEDDLLPEPDETFSIELTLAPGSDGQCRLGDAHAVITIVSDE